jgi:uncharacterized protein
VSEGLRNESSEKGSAIDPDLARLEDHLRALGSVLVCYSGGIDSALVLAVAHRVLGARAVGMTAVSASLASFEREGAIRVAKQIGARHELVDSNEIDDEDYAKNDDRRCFHCKSELYRIAEKKRREWGFDVVVNGTNADDLGDYRPGLEAAKEAGARSPLVECGFKKEDVRRLALLIGMEIWDKPASACLSSRLPYGTRVTRERLDQIGRLEDALHQLGLRQLRVRWHQASQTGLGKEAAIARVEVSEDELERAFVLRKEIVAAGKKEGFAYVTLDMQGYRTGSHNEILKGRSLRVVS